MTANEPIEEPSVRADWCGGVSRCVAPVVPRFLAPSWARQRLQLQLQLQPLAPEHGAHRMSCHVTSFRSLRLAAATDVPHICTSLLLVVFCARLACVDTQWLFVSHAGSGAATGLAAVAGLATAGLAAVGRSPRRG